jgi:hypothetical protein
LDAIFVLDCKINAYHPFEFGGHPIELHRVPFWIVVVSGVTFDMVDGICIGNTQASQTFESGVSGGFCHIKAQRGVLDSPFVLTNILTGREDKFLMA